MSLLTKKKFFGLAASSVFQPIGHQHRERSKGIGHHHLATETDLLSTKHHLSLFHNTINFPYLPYLQRDLFITKIIVDIFLNSIHLILSDCESVFEVVPSD